MIFNRSKWRTALPRPLFFLIFAISGFSGLIYESIWSHYLKLFLGHAAYAQSLVLMIFMGGMAIGSWLTAQFSTRWTRPLQVYALVEAIVGLAALVFHDLFAGVIDLFFSTVLPSVASAGAGNALKWAAASILILPQSILLGMTFPLMSAGIIRRFPQAPGGTLAMLYFSNSIGAAIGVLASGFWLIGLVGLPGTIRVAGALNIGLALLVLFLVGLEASRPAPASTATPADKRDRVVAGVFLLAAFVTGLASFIYEIAWLRMLSLVLGGTTHSFELMLSAFIAGLAFGGLWIRRRIDRIASPVAFSGLVQIVMGVFALLTLPVYLQTFDWMSHLIGALAKNDGGYALFTLARSAISFAVMLPATFMAGMTLPLFTYVIMQKSGEKAIGRVYAANTLGAIAGVIFAVHVGLPVLGLKSLIGAGAALDIVLGLGLLYLARPAPKPLIVVTALAITLVGAVTNMFTTLSPGVLASGVYRHGSMATATDADVLYYQDGKTASISLTAWPDQTLIIAANGKPDAALKEFADENPTDDAITMVMAGSLPLAYRPQTGPVANIGMGSGLTTHTLLASPDIERVDTIEIEAAVLVAARGFGFRVRRAFGDERSRIHIEDAKTYFSLHRTKYDVIVAEPSNPWVSGVASLFTREFYRTIGNYVADDGLFVQWLQLYEFNDELFASVLKALSEGFEDFVIYNTDNANVLIVARPHGRLPSPDFSSLFEGEMEKELRQVGVRSRDDFLVRKIADRRIVLALLSRFDAPANSDYYPYVDLNAGRARFVGGVSGLLPGLSVSRLPVVEMLAGDAPVPSAVSNSATFSRSAQFVGARQTYRAVVGESGGDVSVSFDTGRDIAALAPGSAECQTGMPPGLWLATLHSLVSRTLIYLDREEGNRLLASLVGDDCLQQLPEEFRQTFALYRAVAARDAGAMTTAGLALLASPEVTGDENRRRYALKAALLGAVSRGDSAKAKQIWSDHAATALAGAPSVSPDLLVLVSLAGIDTRSTPED